MSLLLHKTTRLVYLCNPNNPTGEKLSKKELLSIIIVAKKLKTIVFIDECFIELVPKSNESVMSYVKKYDNLFILRSLIASFFSEIKNWICMWF